MSTRAPAARLARLLLLVTVLLALGLVALALLVTLDGSQQPTEHARLGPDILLGLTFPVVGVILTLKRPGNLVGWALALAGVGLLLGGVLDLYGTWRSSRSPTRGSPPARRLRSWAVAAGPRRWRASSWFSSSFRQAACRRSAGAGSRRAF